MDFVGRTEAIKGFLYAGEKVLNCIDLVFDGRHSAGAGLPESAALSDR